MSLNHKEVKIGDILFYTDKNIYNQSIKWGVVTGIYSSEVTLELYEPYSGRIIDGVHEKEFKTPTEWRKLPKNYDCTKRLFKLEYENTKNKFAHLSDARVDNVDDYKKLINAGFFVKVSSVDHCEFEVDYKNREGWRIIRKYPIGKHYPSHISLPYFKLYATYKEAQEDVKSYKDEIERQCNLSDLDWSIEQIDKTIDMWGLVYCKTKEEKKECRDRILALDNVEDIETRLGDGCVQWRYWKHKRWNSIIL